MTTTKDGCPCFQEVTAVEVFCQKRKQGREEFESKDPNTSKERLSSTSNTGWWMLSAQQEWWKIAWNPNGVANKYLYCRQCSYRMVQYCNGLCVCVFGVVVETNRTTTKKRIEKPPQENEIYFKYIFEFWIMYLKFISFRADWSIFHERTWQKSSSHCQSILLLQLSIIFSPIISSS